VSEQGLRPVASLVDRLLDGESVADGRPVGRGDPLASVARAVERDLEHLLNTRNQWFDLPSEFVEAGQSVLTYGLADFTSANPRNVNDQQCVRQIVERAVRLFEPRLSGVTITVFPDSPGTLRLRLDARILVDPVPQPIRFDIVMPLQALRCRVEEAS